MRLVGCGSSAAVDGGQAEDAAADIGVRYACDGAADLELAPAVMPFFVERREALPPGVTQGFGRVLVVAACGEAGVA